MSLPAPVDASHPLRVIKKLCVFCGSSAGKRPVYRDTAEQLGRYLAGAGITLVFGGGRVGLMGVLSDSVLRSGGEVIGVMPRALAEKEIAHSSLTQLHIVETMHERKALMADLADAFVLLPGGFGSWEEFCEVVTWLQLGIHRKPCGILNVAGYYDSLLALTAHAVDQGFLGLTHKDMIIVQNSVEQLLSELNTAPLPSAAKWVSSRER